MSRLARPRFLLLYLLIPLGFLTASSSEGQFRIGVPLVALGLLVRLWANGYVGHRKVNWTQKWRGDAKVGQLITAGPYAHVRHPLYVGTFLIAIGLGVIVGRWFFGLLGLAALAFIYHRKMDEEERTLHDEWGETFRRYQQAVPRWLPRLQADASREGRWSWEGILASKEWKTVVWVLVALIALYIREEWWQEMGRSTVKHAVLIGLAVLLMAADGAIELIRRRAARAPQPPE